MQNKITLLLLILTLQFSIPVLAQTDYSTIKVDNLTDAQILKIINQAENDGYKNLDQFHQMAVSKGMKNEEIDKFKIRVEKILGNRSIVSSENKNIIFNEGSGIKQNVEFEKNINSVPDTTPQVFGNKLFRNGEISFEPNLRIATPKGYIVGPDDKLIIDITGDNEVSYNLNVATDGSITIPYVGRIAISGLTIDEAISKIKSASSKTYPAINTGGTSVAVNLGDIRSIKVIITGQVNNPGTYTLSALSSVFNALYSAGGPSNKGSYRNIQLIRGNKVVQTIDLYNFLLKGLQTGNVRIQDQDVINVPFLKKQVLISGEVNLDAYYEINEEDHIEDVISFAGGLTSKAYASRVKILRNTDKELKVVDVAKEEFSSFKPKNGDQILVETILDRYQNRVEIKGAVFRPGIFEMVGGLTLKKLIENADGLKEDAFLNRGYIQRLNTNNTRSLIAFDIDKILSGKAEDITLNREDVITISSIFDLRDNYQYSIQGDVRAPGVFDFSDNTTLEDLIQMAGGFKVGATPDRIEISRRVKNSDLQSASAQMAELFIVNVDKDLKLLDQSFVLMPYDIVSVRSSDGYVIQKQVKVEGEVMFPGTYTLVAKNDKISDIIKRAGGLTNFAYAKGASLKRPGAKIIDKNAVDESEEEKVKLLNLKRAQEDGVKVIDTNPILLQSDLVGISLDKILDKENSKLDLILEDGDIIRIPKQLQTVKVSGEVLNPNNIVYLKGRSLKRYINGAGGFSASALKKRVYVKYANGSADGTRNFLFFKSYPKVLPGSEVLVPKRAEKERLSAQSWIGIGTAVASLTAIVVNLLR